MADIIEIRHIDLNGGQITKPRWSLDGRFLAIPMESGSIAIFDLDLNQVVQTVGHHSAQVTAVGWNREAQFIMTGSLDRSVGVWEVPGGRKSGITISGHKEPVHSVEWTDEGVVLGSRRHGEGNVILEVMTRDHGRHLGLVRGGAGSRLRTNAP